MIYEPREDSLLMLKNVKKYAAGSVLDMGAGSGILAREAAKKADVLAADINPRAVMHCRRQGINCVESDLFSNVEGRFDLIIFNPPYLPDDSRVSDVALDGGKHGYEVIERFLNEAGDHLAQGGSILLLFSSLSKVHKIDRIIRRELYDFTQIDSLKLDFEELYVYLIRMSDIRKRIMKMGVTGLQYLARGHRGCVYTGKLKGEKVGVKFRSPGSSALNSIGNEAGFLEIVNRHGIGPKLLKAGHGIIIYRYVEGQRIGDYVQKHSGAEVKPVILQLLEQLYRLDQLGINKGEMHNPYKHILVSDRPVLIDFERARHTEKPRNVTQFCSYLAGILNKRELLELARQYAKDRDIEPIKEVFR